MTVPAAPATFEYAPRPLASARLAMEPIAASHADALFEGLADPALYTFIGPPPASVDAMRERFRRLADPHGPGGELWLNHAVRWRPAGAYVGCVQATVRPDRTAYIAYFVFRAAQRQGIAHEACVALLDHLWRDCGVGLVRIECDTRNVPSQRLAEALGFAREGGARATDPVHGAPAFDYVYRLERPARVAPR